MAESGRLFFYPLQAIGKAMSVKPAWLEYHQFAASPLPDLNNYKMVPLEAIAGWSPCDTLEHVDGFTENGVFVKCLHDVLKRWAHLDGSVTMRARMIGNGWVHVVDERGLPCMRYTLCICICIYVYAYLS